MKSKKTLCIVILTVVCVGLMVLTGSLIAKTLHPGPFMPADTSKPSGEVNLKWETAFIEDTPTDMEGDTVTITADTVLTAIYDPIFYTVSFSSDGGTGTEKSGIQPRIRTKKPYGS